jgi:hypothetical protein
VEPVLPVRDRRRAQPPEFPARFDSIGQAREHSRRFFHWYSHAYRHSAIGLMTPAVGCYVRSASLYDRRAEVLTAADAGTSSGSCANRPRRQRCRPRSGSRSPRTRRSLTVSNLRRVIGLEKFRGRQIFANTIKCVMMGTSSNFGDMFSAGGASLFRSFQPMLPSQILLNNLLYDIGEVTIPTDNVDEEQLQKRPHWDIRMIRRLRSSRS